MAILAFTINGNAINEELKATPPTRTYLLNCPGKTKEKEKVVDLLGVIHSNCDSIDRLASTGLDLASLEQLAACPPIVQGQGQGNSPGP